MYEMFASGHVFVVNVVIVRVERRGSGQESEDTCIPVPVKLVRHNSSE